MHWKTVQTWQTQIMQLRKTEVGKDWVRNLCGSIYGQMSISKKECEVFHWEREREDQRSKQSSYVWINYEKPFYHTCFPSFHCAMIVAPFCVYHFITRMCPHNLVYSSLSFPMETKWWVKNYRNIARKDTDVTHTPWHKSAFRLYSHPFSAICNIMKTKLFKELPQLLTGSYPGCFFF